MDLLIFAVPLLPWWRMRVYYVIFYLDLYRKADGSLNWGAIFRHQRTAAWPSTAASLPPP